MTQMAAIASTAKILMRFIINLFIFLLPPIYNTLNYIILSYVTQFI